MSLDKAIANGKEHRKPYYKSGRFDRTCRPHGGCPHCLRNRMCSHHKQNQFSLQYLLEDDYSLEEHMADICTPLQPCAWCVASKARRGV